LLCWNTGIQARNTGIQEYTGILEFWNTGMLEYFNIGILEYWNIHGY